MRSSKTNQSLHKELAAYHSVFKLVRVLNRLKVTAELIELWPATVQGFMVRHYEESSQSQ